MKIFKKVVDLAEQIIPKFYSCFNDTWHMHQIHTSGRSGTKSSYIGIRAVNKIISDPEASVVIIRKFHNKLSKTVYKEVLRAIGRLGLDKKLFHITRSPMQITYKEYGTTIYFTGSDSIDDTKGMIDEDKKIKLVIIDEVTEFFDAGDGEDELTNIEATFVRGNDDEFVMIYCFNPPKNPKEEVMKWAHKMAQREDCKWTHNTYLDVPTKWLGKKLIESANTMKNSDELLYRWLWLGESVGVPEIIYYMFNQDLIYEPGEEDYKSYSMVAIGLDYGQLNATTFQAFGLNVRKAQLQGLDEYYYSGREKQVQKTPSQYAKDFKEFKEKIEKRTGKKVLFLFYDPSARGMAEEIKSVCPDITVRTADNSVETGINRVQRSYALKRMTVSPKQEHLIDEMSLYKYDEKSIKKGKELPIKENDHCCDAQRYLTMGLWRYLKQLAPQVDDGKED